MFDAAKISRVIGKEQFAAVNASDLPKIETMTLLQIWESGSPKKLRKLATSGELMPLLRAYQDALELANEVRGHNSHLTVAECLQVAELPMKL
jgi:hypothetical protein